MADYKQIDSENIKELTERLRESGQPNTADYIEKFGLDFSPWFYHLTPVEAKEAFYKRCVEEGHPWSWYQEALPDEAVL